VVRRNADSPSEPQMVINEKVYATTELDAIVSSRSIHVRKEVVNRTVDWGRATYVAAIAGGVFWALVVHAFATSGNSHRIVVISAAAAVVMVGGGILVFRTSSSFSVRTYAIGVVIAPLTGLAAQIPFALIELVKAVI
jgi:hypothetical protein